jgi:hypothetical protein
MRRRRLFQIYTGVVVAAVAIPVFVRLSFAPDQELNMLTSSCETSMIPAFYLASAVLPVRFYTPETIAQFDPAHDARVYFCVVTGMNVLVWTAITTVLLFVGRLAVRRRPHPTAHI